LWHCLVDQMPISLIWERIRVAIVSLTIGNYVLQLLLALLKGNRSEILGVDRQLAMADAHALYKAGESRLGTNEDTFIHILATRSAAHLTTVSQYYLQAFGHSLEKVSSTSSVCCSHLISSQACSTCHHWMLGISTEFDLTSVPSDAFPN
jgi:hypothetical protein